MTVKLRLQRGEFKQVEGPVTHQRYVFVKSVGHAPIAEVEDVDVDGMLLMRDGCCGVHYPAFIRVEK